MAYTTQVATVSDTEVVISRRFNAPRRLVFECMSKPEYIREWLLGPEGWTMPVCDVDFRVGGKYRYVWAKDDTTMGMGGVFREVVAPEKLASSELFDQDWTGGETLVTYAFDEKKGRTTLAMTIRYSSKEARDGALATPMLEGMESGYSRLDEFIAALG